MNKIEQASYWLSTVILACCLGAILYIGYLSLWPVHIVDWDHPGYIETKADVVKAGDEFPIRYPFTKYMDIFPTIHRRLVNETIYQLPTMVGSSGIGRHAEWYYNTRIPEHLPPGKYKLIIDFVYHLNFLREYKVTQESDWFIVTK